MASSQDSRPRCSKCGRVLTSAASIARGIGPECAGMAVPKGPARPVKGGRVLHGTASSSALATASDALVVSGSSEQVVLHENSIAEDGEK